jgi:hypothetical protein
MQCIEFYLVNIITVVIQPSVCFTFHPLQTVHNCDNPDWIKESPFEESSHTHEKWVPYIFFFLGIYIIYYLKYLICLDILCLLGYEAV